MIKRIWSVFRADWQRLTASVVAVVVMMGLCLVPCLYAWFNILSNWDPYGPASTGNIKVAVANEDEGCEILGLQLNIGSLVMDGLQTNDQMGWVFVDSRAEALDGVESGDYYAALIVLFRSQILTGSPADSRHVQKNITLPDTNSHDSFTIVHSDTFIIDVKEISPAQVATLGGFNSGDIHDFKHRWIHLLILLVNRSAQRNGDNLVISTVLRT